MKSLLKLNRAGSCLCFFIVIALAFSGCCTNGSTGNGQQGQDQELEQEEEQKEEQEIPPPPPPPPPASSPIARTMPVTDEMIGFIKAEPNASEVFYYISKPIILRRVSGSRDASIENHEVILFGSIDYNTIPITAFTKGVLKDTSFGNPLNVTFQTDRGNLLLTFRKQGYGASERYELTKNSSGQITYNGLDYEVEYIGQEVPYLMVVVIQALVG